MSVKGPGRVKTLDVNSGRRVSGHSARGELSCAADNVVLVGPSRLAEMVMEAGLFDWLLNKAS